MQLMIATGNPGKLIEIKSILSADTSLNLDLHTIAELNIPEPDEPHDSFMQNAKHKAHYYAKITGMPTLSEDSGLCIKELQGFPGIRSKEFVQSVGSMQQAFEQLKSMLATSKDYSATFVCATSIYFPTSDEYISYEAHEHGYLSFPPRGDDCFGFDPIFVPKGYNKTMAELGVDIKNKIGHRGKAMREILKLLRDYLASRL